MAVTADRHPAGGAGKTTGAAASSDGVQSAASSGRPGRAHPEVSSPHPRRPQTTWHAAAHAPATNETSHRTTNAQRAPAARAISNSGTWRCQLARLPGSARPAGWAMPQAGRPRKPRIVAAAHERPASLVSPGRQAGPRPVRCGQRGVPSSTRNLAADPLISHRSGSRGAVADLPGATSPAAITCASLITATCWQEKRGCYSSMVVAARTVHLSLRSTCCLETGAL